MILAMVQEEPMGVVDQRPHTLKIAPEATPRLDTQPSLQFRGLIFYTVAETDKFVINHERI